MGDGQHREDVGAEVPAEGSEERQEDNVLQAGLSEDELLTQQLKDEEYIWKKMGIQGDMTQMVSATQVHALINELVALGIITENALNIRYRKLLLERMKEARFGVAQAMARSKILDQDGRPII